jgi:hypothetical protein
VAIFLGNGGYEPHDAATVLENRYGDCKDHVALLEALLKAKGIASVPVLVGSSSTSPRRPGADRRRGPQTNQRIAKTLRDRAATTGTFKSDCRR